MATVLDHWTSIKAPFRVDSLSSFRDTILRSFRSEGDAVSRLSPAGGNDTPSNGLH
jgi:hypothetical protein